MGVQTRVDKEEQAEEEVLSTKLGDANEDEDIFVRKRMRMRVI